jgi:uncharacterized membrane protein YdbT with pleckstrin-like domain
MNKTLLLLGLMCMFVVAAHAHNVRLYGINTTNSTNSTVGPSLGEIAEWQTGVWVSIVLTVVVAAVAWMLGGMAYTNDTLLFRYTGAA